MQESRVKKRIEELQNDSKFSFKLTSEVIDLVYRQAISDIRDSVLEIVNEQKEEKSKETSELPQLKHHYQCEVCGTVYDGYDNDHRCPVCYEKKFKEQKQETKQQRKQFGSKSGSEDYKTKYETALGELKKAQTSNADLKGKLKEAKKEIDQLRNDITLKGNESNNSYVSGQIGALKYACTILQTQDRLESWEIIHKKMEDLMSEHKKKRGFSD